MRGSGLRGVALAATVAACAGPGVAGPALELACIGTEPFWRLDLSADAARFTPMEGAEATYAGSLARAVNRTTAFVWRGAAAASPDGGGGPLLVAAVERTGACSDGMSDIVYPFAAIVSLPDGTALAGCCRGDMGPSDAPR